MKRQENTSGRISFLLIRMGYRINKRRRRKGKPFFMETEKDNKSNAAVKRRALHRTSAGKPVFLWMR
jgi:hypothetical protein